MSKIFGTDGIRGYTNQYPMTADVALKVGMAVALLGDNNKEGTNRVLIGKDTRLSGYMFENALVAGLTSMGKDVILVGPMPTPAVAMLTRSTRSEIGIMISASHNPYFDNGIKIFDQNGYKISDDFESKIETLIQQDLSTYLVKADCIGKVERLKESFGRYIEYVKSAFPMSYNLRGLKIVVDCAHGALYKIAPIVFYELGAKVIPMGVEPNGLNINVDCGSTHVEALRTKVLEVGADIGVAFDGDADRLIMVDEKGKVIDGDNILAVIAVKFKNEGSLRDNCVVGTVMANLGFENYLKSQGIKLIRAAVGDRYVSEAMIKGSYSLGGEQSGHIILSNYNTTGDGLLASLEAISVLIDSKLNASQVFHLYEPTPQVLKNIRYSKDKSGNIMDNENIKTYISNKQLEFAEGYRILVRKSGTENLIRVMVEGKDKTTINIIADDIINYINSCL